MEKLSKKIIAENKVVVSARTGKKHCCLQATSSKKIFLQAAQKLKIWCFVGIKLGIHVCVYQFRLTQTLDYAKKKNFKFGMTASASISLTLC